MTDDSYSNFWWEDHYSQILEAMIRGRLVVVLGSDINLCNRPLLRETGQRESWQIDEKYPPSNRELAIHLDEMSGMQGLSYRQETRCPLCDAEDIKLLPDDCPLRKAGAVTKMDLQNVSQYILTASEQGQNLLRGALTRLFQKQYPPNSIHNFFAQLPRILQDKNYCPTVPYPLIVTTCFDRTLEQTFEGLQQPYDLVSFVSDAEESYFLHRTPNGQESRIEDPETYGGSFLKEYPVILKLYGGYAGTFVITEDNYIDYLAHKDTKLPKSLLGTMQASNTTVWFLGYSPYYWNLRVILRRIWSEQISRTDKHWWAIQANPEILNEKIWKQYAVQVPPHDGSSLENYIRELSNRLEGLPSKKGTTSTPSATAERNQVFISYSHEDKDWLGRLQKMLKPAMRHHNITVWDDTKIKAGTNWKEEIKAALAVAKVAVLLVSTDFLASDFITQEEVPTLLEAAKEAGLKLLWIYLRDCLYDCSDIADYQAAHDISQPLESLKTEAEQDKVLTQISQTIVKALKT